MMPDSFLTSVRLNIDIEREAVGGPAWNDFVLQMDSGNTKANRRWVDTIAEYNVGYGLMRKFKSGADIGADVNEILSLHYVAGRAFTFRFKDYSDFEIGMELGQDVAIQQLGVGTGAQTVFQAKKTYGVGAHTHDRTITKLVTGTVRVYLDGVEQSSGFTADNDRGTITFTVAPAIGVVVGLRAEFDVHVRFGLNKINVNMQMFNAGSIPDISLQEVRGTGLA